MAQEQNISQDLYDLLVSRNLDPETSNESGLDAQSSDSSIFSFDWKSSAGRNYGTAVVVITDDGELILFFGDNLGRGMEEPDKTEWYDFMRTLKDFATRNNLKTFDSQNLSKLKHTMAGMAAIKEGLFEGYYGTRKVSYMGEQRQARLMIRHKRDLDETDRRHLNVASLFIETAEGERFKLPFTDLRGGKAMLTHVREGGRPYDVRGVHIAEMVEELKVLSRFNRASAHRVSEGVTQELVEQARTYYRDLRENIRRMGGHRGYQKYFETWTPLTETDSESLVEDIKTLFIEQTLDTRIEAALPVLAKIKETTMREADIFESYINRLAEGTWAVPDTPEAERKLQELMATELPVGPDATNATEQIYDLIGDDELFDQLEQLARDDPDADARPVILDRLEELGYSIGRDETQDNLSEFTGDEMQYATITTPTAADNPERPVGVLMFGRFGKTDPYARTAWAALQRELPQEYPNEDAAAARVAEIAKHGGTIVTEKPRPEAERLVKRFQAYGLKSRVVDDNLREQNTASGRRMPRIGDTLQWRSMKDTTTRTGTVLDIKAFDATVLPKRLPGETAYPRPVGINLANKQLTFRVIPAEQSLTQPGGWTPQTPLEEADDLSTFEGSGCNHTMEGESCPVHGLRECGMYEEDDRADYNRTADELNRAREAGDMERIKQLSGQLSKQAGPRGFEIDIRGNAKPLKESDELARLKNLF